MVRLSESLPMAKTRFSLDGHLHYGIVTVTHGKPYKIELSGQDGFERVAFAEDITLEWHKRKLDGGREAVRNRLKADVWLAEDEGKRIVPFWMSYLSIG
jgi:hypothetical protein